MSHNLKSEREERELLDSYERDEWQSAERLQERLRQYQACAIATFEAMGMLGIALPQEDLKVIREKAALAGMSSQMYIASILHQYVKGDLVQKPRGV